MSRKGEKRKAETTLSTSNETNDGSKNRRETFHRIATERAAHFARAQPSSTPTGLETIRFSNNEDEEEDDAWCGPFATANRLLKQRDKAKIDRDNAIAGAVKDDGSDSDPDLGRVLDIYDSHIKSLARSAKDDRPPLQKHRPTLKSLTALCLEKLAIHFEDVSDLGDLTLEYRAKLAELLSQRRKLCNEAVLVLALEGSRSLFLPECSSVSQDALQAAIHKVAQSGTESVGITTLKLYNCGFGFTEKVVEVVVPHASSIEDLAIVGCYRLGVPAMKNILSATSNLQSLDISYNNRIDGTVLAQMQSLTSLTSVRLDFCPNINGEHLSYLGKLKSVQYVSIAGINDIRDDHMVPFLREVGRRIKGLNCSGCNQLSDKSLQCLREQCVELRELDISGCLGFSSLGILSLFVPMDKAQEAFSRPLALKSAVLQNLSQLTDESVIHLAEASGNNLLERIDVSSCDKLSDRSIAALRIHSCQSLQKLDISFVRDVTESLVLDLIRNCFALTHLNIWGCSQIKATSLSFFRGSINSYR